MAIQTQRTANDVASLFVEQALTQTQQYLERMRQAGERHLLSAVYDTCVLGGINTELSFKQARWLLSLMQREENTGTGQVRASNLVVGTWLYYCWVDRGNRTRHRLIYTFDSSFAAARLFIDAATLQRAMVYGQAERA